MFGRQIYEVPVWFLVIADAVHSAQPRDWSWPLHGNGGGVDGMTSPQPALNSFDKMFEPAAAIPATPYSASGGTFDQTPFGGVWTRSAARVSTAMAFARDVAATMSTSLGIYEQLHGRLGSNAVLTTQAHGRDLNAASVIYPSRTSIAAPTIYSIASDGAAVIRISDPAADHEILVIVRRSGMRELRLSAAQTGMPVSLRTDAAIAIVDVHRNGKVSKLYFEGGTHLTLG